MMFVAILLALAVTAHGKTLPRNTRQANDNKDTGGFQTLPRRAVVQPGESITLLGNAGIPLKICHFYLPGPRGRFIDFSLGPASNSTDQYEYWGSGLEMGDCGIRIKKVADTDDGIVECQVQAVGSIEVEKSGTTLRVTNVLELDLPVFNIEPRTATLARGDTITITCNADRPINMCTFYLPGPQELRFDQGRDSKATDKYRYFGNGLENGECGVTLTDVDERLTGFAVCKVGKWPETVNGEWETDVLKVVTTNDILTPTTKRPPQESYDPNATECPPLLSNTVNITCTFAGKRRDCSKPLKIRSLAFLECNAGHAKPDWIIYKKITCEKGGVWNPPPFTCKPDCGKRLTNKGRPQISNGEEGKIGEFPWHVGVYQRDKSTYSQICGGSLITTSLIISAAHCFWDNNENVQVSQTNYKVAAGKHFRELAQKSPRDQVRDAAEIIVPWQYRGRGTNFKFDIALIRVETPFVVMPEVNLICIDWNNRLEDQQLTEPNEGVVPGWGFTEKSVQSNELRYINLPYIPREKCLKSLTTEEQLLLTEDKFCAGFVNRNKSVCPGDSGGGLVFLDPATNKYYLRGLVSIAFSYETQICNSQKYTGFTKFVQYKEWIQNNFYSEQDSVVVKPLIENTNSNINNTNNLLSIKPTAPISQKPLPWNPDFVFPDN